MAGNDWVSKFTHDKVVRELDSLKRYINIDSVVAETKLVEINKLLDSVFITSTSEKTLSIIELNELIDQHLKCSWCGHVLSDNKEDRVFLDGYFFDSEFCHKRWKEVKKSPKKGA